MVNDFKEMPVLDKGFVRLDGFMPGDLSVVNSARVSFGKRKEQMEEADIKLIGFLMRGQHGTPFEHNAFRFHIKAPIFVAREWMRHRIGSFNEFSGRYSEFDEGEFYLPKREDLRKQVGKPGHYTFDPIDDNDAAWNIWEVISITNRDTYAIYQQLLQSGLAKELARTILPVGMYTQFYWTVNARSLMNFIALRNAPQAQYEIREYAKVVEQVFGEMMPITYKTFVENNRSPP